MTSDITALNVPIIPEYNTIILGDCDNRRAVVGGMTNMPNMIKLPVNFIHIPIVITIKLKNINSIFLTFIFLESARSLLRDSKIKSLK